MILVNTRSPTPPRNGIRFIVMPVNFCNCSEMISCAEPAPTVAQLAALVRAGEEHLRRQGAYRITALVAHEDEVASAFWKSAGYPRDRQIGRRVRSL